ARVTCRGDRRHHPTGRLAVAAPDLARLDGIAIEGGGGRYVADPDRLAEHVDPDGAQEGPRDAAGRDARRGLARARTLDHVADVLVTVLERSGKVRVSRPQPRHRVRRLGDRRHAHDALPVHGVAVRDPHGDRRAGGPSLPEAAGDASAVPLDALPRSASVPELATA